MFFNNNLAAGKKKKKKPFIGAFVEGQDVESQLVEGDTCRIGQLVVYQFCRMCNSPKEATCRRAVRRIGVRGFKGEEKVRFIVFLPPSSLRVFLFFFIVCQLSKNTNIDAKRLALSHKICGLIPGRFGSSANKIQPWLLGEFVPNV